MGKITQALKKVADERVARIQKKPDIQYIVRRVENTAIDDHVVSFHDPSSLVGEQYNIIRTNLRALGDNKNFRTFVITSALNREGKSITTLNIAIKMAQDISSGSVLLIDADMRRGTVAKYLGIEQNVGLSEVLRNKASEDEVLISPNNIDNFTVLPSGAVPKNPSELLNSKRMEQLLESLRTRFDYIFIDSPPVMPLVDACILGSMVDGVILVVQAGRTQRDIIKHMESRLMQARAKTLGFVMTQMEYHIPHSLQRYVYGHSYYSSYIQDKKETNKQCEEVEVG